MKFYSYQGQEPAPLPSRFRLENGSTITRLDKATPKELSSYGFSGPFEVPHFDQEKQEISWNGEEYVVTDIPEEIISQREIEKQNKAIKSIDKSHFYQIFKSSSFYARIRRESGLDLKANVLYVELITSIETCNLITEIFNELDKLFYLIIFTEEEVQSLEKCFSEFNLTYDIPEITSTYYDFDSDSVVDTTTRPFESWIRNGTKWTAPVPYPTDGKHYVWNETTKKWNKL
jgi:hypothetical protein